MDLMCKHVVLRRCWLALPVIGNRSLYFNAYSMKSNHSVPWYRERFEKQDHRDKGSKSRVKGQEHRSSILKIPGVVTVRDLTKEKLCEHLAQNVVYREGPLLAINKPQGLSIAGTSEEVTLLSILPELQQKLQIKPALQVVKSAPKQSSGLVLLSTCHVTTQKFEDYYVQCRKSGNPFTTFCAVTVGVPSPEEGEVKVVLKADEIGGLDLVVPVMNTSKGSLERREVKRTETRYKVLNSGHGCSLLQLQPMTVFQDQLLVHCSLKFCPVLGDHTYSSRVAKVLGENIYVPVDDALPKTQLLEDSILRRMHFPFTQLDRMPLHLHLHQLLMPDHPPGQYPTHLTAPLPPFFQRTMEFLGLKLEQ
ncbi:mitochondrial mRNA pseudouridine synthase RPUSD3 [Mixophyes fleayi]|uniref:mitochondrial mRNA pseudouridine synthase RPUSD3 n=1 Tax=Mixophyes fleayi TaxID=3061075 RepID=UPI003F4D739B